MGTLRTAFLSALALELIATISVAVVAVFIGVRLVHGDMPLEAGLLALILAPDCYLPLRELGTAHHASDDGRAALAETTAVTDAPEPRPLPAGKARAGRPTAAPRLLRQPAGGVTVTGLDGDLCGQVRTRRRAPHLHCARRAGSPPWTAPAGPARAPCSACWPGRSATAAGTSVTGQLAGFERGSVAWVPQHPVMVQPTVLDEVLLYLAGGAGPADRARGAGTRCDGGPECLAAAAAGHLAAKHPAELSPGELRRVALARGLARIRPAPRCSCSTNPPRTWTAIRRPGWRTPSRRCAAGSR